MREIREALSESRRLFVSCAVFSGFVNLLMLTGPLFMLQVYDRVLTSRSLATLVALVVIVTFLFLNLGVLDHARGRVLARAGAQLQTRLDSRVLRAILSRSISPAERSRPATGLRDLEAIQRFASSSGPFAFFDAPWTPVFLFALFMFHWTLGLLAVFSGCLLLLIALLDQGTAGAERKRTDAAARPAVRIVRGGRKGAAAARTAEPRPRGSERQGERSRSKPAGPTASPDRDFARERRRRIAGAIVRVSGARAPTGGDGGSGACDSDGSVRGTDPRTNRDGAS